MRKSIRTAVVAGAAAALAATAVAAPASAAPKNKGATTVAPSFEVEDVLRPGSLGDSGAVFGIVGKPGSTLIKHVGGVVIDGSEGVLADEDLEIRNFWIDTAAGTVSGDVENFGRGDLFTLTSVDISEDGKTITADLLFTELASLAVVGAPDPITGQPSIVGLPAGSATINLT